MQKSFKILHISDIHFSLSSLDDCLDKLIITLTNFCGRIDFVVVSGDIANKGKETEFEDCKKLFLDQINKSIGHEDYSNYIFVPGNHDIERFQLWRSLKRYVKNYLKDSDRPENEIKETLSNKEIYSQYFSEKDIINNILKSSKDVCKSAKKNPSTVERKLNKLYLKSFKNFVEFTRKLDGYSGFINKLSPFPDTNWTSSLFGVKTLTSKSGVDVDFIGLNSSWFCTGNDMGSLFLLADLIDFPTQSNKNTTVSVMHHPPSWFHWEQKNGIGDIPTFGRVAELSDIILTGHEHDRHIQPPTYYNSETLLICSGSTYVRDSKHPNNIKILEINTSFNKPESLSYEGFRFTVETSNSEQRHWEYHEAKKLYPIKLNIPDRDNSFKKFWKKEVDLIAEGNIDENDINEFLIKSFLKNYSFIIPFKDLTKNEFSDYELNSKNKRHLLVPLNLEDFDLFNSKIARYKDSTLYDYFIAIPFVIIDAKLNKTLKTNTELLVNNLKDNYNSYLDLHIEELVYLSYNEIISGKFSQTAKNFIDSIQPNFKEVQI